MELTKKKLGYIEGLSSSIINVGLFALKLWVGIISGSVAMIADSWHTLSDTLTSIVVLFGFWISGKPRDMKHPFGHGRAELIAALIIGTLLGLVGLNFLKDSYLQLKNAHAVRFSLLSIVIFLISVFIKEGLAQFSMWAGRKTKSTSLIADGWHHRSDAIASALIVVGALFGRYFWWIDGVLGILVSLLIIYAAFTIIKEAADTFMGEEADSRLKQEIEEVIKRVIPDMKDMHHLHVHKYGDHVEVTLHVNISDKYTFQQAHDLTTQVENSLRESLKIEPTIHIEPVKKIL
ncbi:MAG: cation diffusion facilitator family transporter [Spirochaetota bacterium]